MGLIKATAVANIATAGKTDKKVNGTKEDKKVPANKEN